MALAFEDHVNLSEIKPFHQNEEPGASAFSDTLAVKESEVAQSLLCCIKDASDSSLVLPQDIISSSNPEAGIANLLIQQACCFDHSAQDIHASKFKCIRFTSITAR